ncbi:hypothetical protein BDQ17DRAFT_1332018 [Cyathus striatus]|nr:hypothetical protein BDQ17DRAFT_1332018 [Cyathus striatus]
MTWSVIVLLNDTSLDLYKSYITRAVEHIYLGSLNQTVKLKDEGRVKVRRPTEARLSFFFQSLASRWRIGQLGSYVRQTVWMVRMTIEVVYYQYLSIGTIYALPHPYGTASSPPAPNLPQPYNFPTNTYLPYLTRPSSSFKLHALSEVGLADEVVYGVSVYHVWLAHVVLFPELNSAVHDSEERNVDPHVHSSTLSTGYFELSVRYMSNIFGGVIAERRCLVDMTLQVEYRERAYYMRLFIIFRLFNLPSFPAQDLRAQPKKRNMLIHMYARVLFLPGTVEFLDVDSMYIKSGEVAVDVLTVNDGILRGLGLFFSPLPPYFAGIYNPL